MKNKLVKMMALLTATTMVAAGVMGCGSDSSSDANADANTDTTASDASANADTTDGADVSGTVTLAGSTSMEKLANIRMFPQQQSLQDQAQELNHLALAA